MMVRSLRKRLPGRYASVRSASGAQRMGRGVRRVQHIMTGSRQQLSGAALPSRRNRRRQQAPATGDRVRAMPRDR